MSVDLNKEDIAISLQAVMGSDLTVANAARASYAKQTRRMTPKDGRLIQFLGTHGHTSPFRHAAMRFEVRSTVEERIIWETALTNRGGMVFEPALGDLISLSVRKESTGRVQEFIPNDTLTWRWTASVQGVARFLTEAWAIPPLQKFLPSIGFLAAGHFKESIVALTGDSAWADEPAVIPELSDDPTWAVTKVLDKGYVRYVHHMPGETDIETLFTFEVRAPLFVRAQWFKYVHNSHHTPALLADWHPFEEVGSGQGEDCGWDDLAYARNEMSGRYVTWGGEPEFYVPGRLEWRSKPENSKQGSGAPLPLSIGFTLAYSLERDIRKGIQRYNEALAAGAAPEIARGFLNYAFLYSNWYWTGTRTALKFFLEQRLGHEAQFEITQYARAVKQIATQAGILS